MALTGWEKDCTVSAFSDIKKRQMAGRLTVEKFSPLRSVGIEERGAVAGLIDERGEAAGMTDHGEKAQATQKLITNVLDFSKKAPHDQIARFRGSERCSFKSFKSAVVGGLGQEKNVFGNRYIMGVAQAQNNIRRKQKCTGPLYDCRCVVCIEMSEIC